jgi:hypothetical protein
VLCLYALLIICVVIAAFAGASMVRWYMEYWYNKKPCSSEQGFIIILA